MGCSASMTPPTVIQSIKKVDMATNTTQDDFSLNSVPEINPIKHLVEISTQTDDLQVNVKTNQTVSSEENQNKDSNLRCNDSQKVLDNQDEPVEWTGDHINPRFNQDLYDREELEWILNDMDANQFCINNQALFMSANQITPEMVVNAMEKADDLKSVTKTVWNLLNNARKTGDATYLIRAYTAESDFYKILNRRLARQTLGNPTNLNFEEQIQTMMTSAFSQLNQVVSYTQALQAGQQTSLQNNTETDWAKLYLKAVYRLIMTPNSTLRYQGSTYRGIRLTLKELEQYEDKQYVCNKAITSTSKLRSVAQGFIDSGPRPENMFDVMFIYVVESVSALLAIDVHTLSLIPDEEEVLIMPGILFSITKINVTSRYSVEIEMRSAFQELADGGLDKLLGGLFSTFQQELD